MSGLYVVRTSPQWPAGVVYDELDALLEQFGVSPRTSYARPPPSAPSTAAPPFVVLRVPSLAQAVSVFTRSVLLSEAFELWSRHSCASVHDAVASVALLPALELERYLAPGSAWRIGVTTFGCTLSLPAIEGVRNHFRSALPFAGPVRLRGPVEVDLQIILQFECDQTVARNGGGGSAVVGGAPLARPEAAPGDGCGDEHGAAASGGMAVGGAGASSGSPATHCFSAAFDGKPPPAAAAAAAVLPSSHEGASMTSSIVLSAEDSASLAASGLAAPLLPPLPPGPHAGDGALDGTLPQPECCQAAGGVLCRGSGKSDANISHRSTGTTPDGAPASLAAAAPPATAGGASAAGRSVDAHLESAAASAPSVAPSGTPLPPSSASASSSQRPAPPPPLSNTSPLRNVFVGRRICATGRHLVDALCLRKRVYLGPTSLDAEIALMMANLAQIDKCSFVYDPFVGTGSTLVAAAKITGGCFVFGSDIDVRVLKHKAGKGVHSNFEQYDLGIPDIARLDNAAPAMREMPFFHAIISDPPYGIRAGARRSGVPDEKKKPIPAEWRATHVPRTQTYREDDVMFDLLDRASRLLLPGGRLVFLYPALRGNYSPDILPFHPCLEVVSDGEDALTNIISRRIVCARKVRPYDHSAAASYRAASDAAAARCGLFGVSIRERLSAAYEAWFESKKAGVVDVAAVVEKVRGKANAKGKSPAGKDSPAPACAPAAVDAAPAAAAAVAAAPSHGAIASKGGLDAAVAEGLSKKQGKLLRRRLLRQYARAGQLSVGGSVVGSVQGSLPDEGEGGEPDD